MRQYKTVNLLLMFYVSVYDKDELRLNNLLIVNYMIDGPKGSLRRLRSRLAEDGCPESQVILAKQLLEERCGKL